MADLSEFEDWIELGPPCMNCGERIEDCEILLNAEDLNKVTGVIFRGMCRSNICRKLPPGGNPFMYSLGSKLLVKE